MVDFYRAFEDRHRGSRTLIKERLTVYLPFVTPLLEHYPNGQCLDLGCGRGEWLELLTESGFTAMGVDLDAGMLSACHELNLRVEHKDALAALRDIPDGSLCVVTAFHVVEHIPFSDMCTLISEAIRTLVPGGILILETPNPENVLVAGCNFYLDPTHERPIPPELLRFAVEHAGYEKVKIVRLQEPVSLRDPKKPVDLMSVLTGVSPDYAVVAQKYGPRTVVAANAEIFERNFGIDLATLTKRYIDQTKETQRQVLMRANEAIEKAQRAEITIRQMEHELYAIKTSILWRITFPINWIATQYSLLRTEGPIKRLKAALRQSVQVASRAMENYPRIRRAAIRVARQLGIADRLRRVVSRSTSSAALRRNVPTDMEDLTPRAQNIYNQIKGAQKQKGHE